jgi:predicted DNA-binding protein
MARKVAEKKPEEKETGKKDEKQLALRLPRDLHLKLKLKCVKEGRPMVDVLVEAIKKYVES